MRHHIGLLGAVLLVGACATTRPPAGESDLRARMERADAAWRQARLIDAEVLYRALTLSNPNLPEVWLRLGSIYVRQGQLEAADRAYRDGIRVNAKDGRLWFNLSLVQLRQAVETLEVSSEVLEADSLYRPSIAGLHRALLDVPIDPAAPGADAGSGSP